jgi:hypothetical protein
MAWRRMAPPGSVNNAIVIRGKGELPCHSELALLWSLLAQKSGAVQNFGVNNRTLCLNFEVAGEE